MARKKYSAAFKFNLVVEALRSPERTDAEIARQHGVHPVTFAKWKAQFLEKGAQIFGDADKEIAHLEEKVAHLERALGQKEVELALIRNFTSRR